MTEGAVFISLELKVLEDLHSGTGTGSGDIDALVTKDRHGNPVVRASHYKGLLREAGNELLAINKAAMPELNKLLGQAGDQRSSLSLTSLKCKQAARYRTWGNAALTPGKRHPMADMLRFIEFIPAGTEFECTLRLGDPTLLPLLEALIKRVDRIGAHRNRGAGLIEVKLVRPEHRQRPALPAIANTATRLILKLRNLEPLCLPDTGHPGNLIKTLPFIRGQAIMGAFMAWALRHGRTPDLNGVSWGDALPLPQTGLAATTSTVATVMPIPLALLSSKPKPEHADLPWWAMAAPVTQHDLYQAQSGGEKMKRPAADEFIARTGNGAWLRYQPDIQVQLRNQTPLRGTTDDPQLFSNEEIMEDTWFQSEVRFTDQEAATRFCQQYESLLNGNDWLTLGRGGRPVVIEQVMVAKTPPPAKSKQQGSSWLLTLTSDTILRGENLGFLSNLNIATLCQLANMNANSKWRIANSTVETVPVHGFNAASGLRRTPALALRRGSCWLVGGKNCRQLADKLNRLNALGERCDEGFGRFEITDRSTFNELKTGDETPPELNDNRGELLLEEAKVLADSPQLNNQKAPSKSQLQWLRNQALAAKTDADLGQVLKEVELAPQRRPAGGDAWKSFPLNDLRGKLDECQDLEEQRLLISHLVQWRMLALKEKR